MWPKVGTLDSALIGLLRDGADTESIARYFGTHERFVVERIAELITLYDAADVSELVALRQRQRDEERRLVRPTQGQVRLLGLLKAGRSTEEIAAELGRTRRTISMRIVELLILFDVGSRSELIAAWDAL